MTDGSTRTDPTPVNKKGGTATSRAIDSPLKWHVDGGKSYVASKIVALMPPHLHYVEPYFGGGSVLLARNPEGVSEVANDLNGQLSNFWECLRDGMAFRTMARMLEATPFSSKAWDDAGEWLAQSARAPVDHATAFFVRCRQSLAGRMDAFAPLSRTRTRRGMNEQASAWLNAVDGLAQVHERLKRVVILNRDAVKVIRQQDGVDTLFYLDPPYLHETRATTGEYAHEMTFEQHKELLDTLSGIKGKFVLSGYTSDLYRGYEVTFGWNKREFSLPNNAAGGTEKRRMTECVWMNYQPPAKPS